MKTLEISMMSYSNNIKDAKILPQTQQNLRNVIRILPFTIHFKYSACETFDEADDLKFAVSKGAF